MWCLHRPGSANSTWRPRFAVSVWETHHVRARVAALVLGTLLASGCADDPTGPPTAPDRRPNEIALVSGDAQVGSPGKLLRALFRVQVTNASGKGVPAVTVTWSVSAGGGSLYTLGRAGTVRSGWTNTDGFAEVLFWPSVLGPSTVTAVAEGLEGSPVTFTIEAEPPVFDSALFFTHAEYLDPAGAGAGGPANYVFYEDSTFVLQYLQQTDRWSVGTYSVTDSAISLDFGGSGHAMAERHGDSLVVRYDLSMAIDDFWDALFLRFEPQLTGMAAISQSGGVYERMDREQQSPYILFDYGTFILQYGANGQYSGGPAYRGTYEIWGNRIQFDFTADPRWEATGELGDDVLDVRYNTIMTLTDFVDGNYIRSGGWNDP